MVFLEIPLETSNNTLTVGSETKRPRIDHCVLADHKTRTLVNVNSIGQLNLGVFSGLSATNDQAISFYTTDY